MLGWAAFVTVAIDISTRVDEPIFAIPGVLLLVALLGLSVETTYLVYYKRKIRIIAKDPMLRVIIGRIESIRVHAASKNKDITTEEILSEFDSSCHDFVDYALERIPRSSKDK
ncbi:MAG: hypothetical protein JRN15_05770 [Nitrososphaerota archaeon]|nr:hypothetical protein [Nitrososphaerota archaeon]